MREERKGEREGSLCTVHTEFNTKRILAWADKHIQWIARVKYSEIVVRIAVQINHSKPVAAGSELILVKECPKHSWWKLFLTTEAAPLIFQYSHLFTGGLLKASWVTECKAFHLVYVRQCGVWKPGPLNTISAGPANWARSIHRDGEQVGTVATSKRF